MERGQFLVHSTGRADRIFGWTTNGLDGWKEKEESSTTSRSFILLLAKKTKTNQKNKIKVLTQTGKVTTDHKLQELL